MAHTVLVVPVPELEWFVRERTRHYDASFLSPDPAFVHAHVTLLAPFLDAATPHDLDRVGEIAARTSPFDFELTALGAFPDGTIRLLPEPSTPFSQLTRRLIAAFPQCPPYDGRFADPVPHLTLDRCSEAPGEAAGETVSVNSVRARVGALPIRCRADRVALHRYANHDCRVLEEWKL